MTTHNTTTGLEIDLQKMHQQKLEELKQHLTTLTECLDMEIELRGSHTEMAHDLRTLITETATELDTHYFLGRVTA